MCRDVLSGHLPGIMDWDALLSDAPASVAPALTAAIQECLSQTSEEQEIPVFKPPLSSLTRLVRLLMQSLAEDLWVMGGFHIYEFEPTLGSRLKFGSGRWGREN